MPQAEIVSESNPVSAPPLSATSDAPIAFDPGGPPLSDEVVAGARTRDAQGRFTKTVDTQNAQDNSEPEAASADKNEAEGPGPDQQARSTSDPAAAAAFRRRDDKIAALESTVAQLQTELAKATAPTPQPKPSYTDFTDPEAYEAALTKWAKEEGIREAQAQAAEDRTKAQERARADAVVSAWNERVEAFEADHSDFRQAVAAEDLAISPAMTAAIAQLENGPAVAYHLAGNKDEARRISRLDPMRTFMEIGRLSQSISAPVAPAKRLPNPPPDRGARNAAVERPDNEISVDEYAERHAKRLAFNAHQH